MGGSSSGTSLLTRNIGAVLLKGLHKAAPKVARKKAVQWTTKVVGAMPEDLLYRAPLMTNSVQSMKTSADIIDRKLGNVVEGDDGNYVFSNDKTWGSAVWQGEANAIIENYSEMFGTHLEGVLSLGTMAKVADIFGAKRMSALLTKASSGELSGIAATVKKHFSQLGVSDYVGEVGEEYYGQLWRTMLNVDDAYKQNPDGSRTNLFLDGQFHGDIWGGMALSMGLMGLGRHSITAASYVEMKYRVNKADKRASGVFDADAWEGLRERIDGTTNNDIGELADKVIFDDSLSDEQKDAVMGYMEASMNLRGFNLASIARQRGMEMSAEEALANEGYIDGYSATTPQEMVDARLEMERQRMKLVSSMSEDVADEFDADPLDALARTYDPEIREIASKYVNARMVYDGMIQRVRDDIDGRIAQSDAMIDGRVNRDTGMIQGATLTDGKEVYVVNGSVAMLDDGINVDIENSDESLIVRDAEGRLEFVAPSQVQSLLAPVDAASEKEAAAEAIRNEIAQSAADKIDGVLHFAPNDVYAVINEDGSSESLTIVGESVDASGVAVDGMVDVMREDGSVVAMNTADIQRMVDESNARRLEERDKARESAEADKGVEADGGGLQGDAAADAERSTALSRIPVDESGEPLYEQVDADTAWDAFVEQSEGDEEIAREVVADIVAEKRKELADAEKALKSIGESKPNASNGEGALTVQERIVAKMALKRALTDARDAVERAKGVVDHWQSIGDTVKRRAEAEAAERRRQAEIAAEEARQAAERERIEADGGGGTLLSFAERGRQGDIQNTQRRQQDYIPQTEEITANLSEEETDEYGKPLVLAKDGTTVFGFIDFESGLTEAPIRLSLGENSKDKKGVNHGYGLMHIEAGHGDQIRNAGYETVEEFVEDVAKNYTEITEGAKIGDNQTYLLEVPDKHNNTLFVQLSKDGTYWNVNSAGIFKKRYSRRKPKVYSVPALRDGKDTDTTEVNSGQSNGATAPAGNSSQTSKAEVNENFIEKQADIEEKRDGRKELAAVTMWKKKNFTHTDANHEVTPIPDLSEVSDGKGNALSTHNQIIVDESPYKQEDNAESLNHGLDDLDDSALAERIVVSDDDWTEGDGETPTYKRTINIDGKHTVVQVDEPDGNGFYTGSYFDYQGTRFGGIAEVIEHIDKHVKLASDIAAAEAEVNTSPTDKQKEAGNYKKGHVRVGAFDVTIENPKGSVRRGTDATGKKWEQTMSHTYGYIKGTEGVDGDHIDVFLSSDIDGWDGRRVYVVDQYNPDGTFDEHKVMLGFNSEDDAYNAYLSNYESGWEKGRRLDVGAVDIREFEKWVDSSHRKTKAFSEYRSVKSDRRGMDEREISSLLNKMKSQAVTIPYVEITEESWKQYFETPIGNVKMGENQKEKLFNKDRTNQYGMLAETLSNPDIILEESDQQENIFHERPSSYLFIKTFKKRDGSKYVHFENVTVSQGGLEVSISSHIIRENQLKNKMKSDRLLYKATALDESVNSSAEQPINKGDSLSSTGKDNALSSEKQANNKKSSDWNGVETEGTFLGEKEYIERMVENAFNNRKDKSQARKEWEDEDEYISTYNRIADSYVDYISGLKERGELQRMYDAASLGDRIKIRNGVATAGFEVHEMIDFEKERQQARRKRKERKAEHTKAIMSKIGISTDTTEVAEPGQNTAGATDSDAKFSVGSEVKGDADAYNATKGLVESTGIEVVEVSGEEAQAMMEQKNTPFAGLPNRANEKQSSGSVFLSINGNSSSNRADSKEYEAKLQNKTLSAKTKIAKFKNGDYLVNTGSLSDTIKDLGKLLAMDTKGGSRYTILRTDKGDTVAIRLSDHRANGNNFGRDAAERNLSIVIERKRYDVPDSGIEFTEVVIPQSVFESRPEEVVSAIVNGVEAVLADKPFTLDSSIGTVEEIGQNVGHAHLLHTPSGVVYGWTVGGKVYLNRDAMNPEAPIHEYTHLWDEMVRRENPHLWERGKDLMKQMPLWNEIVADSNYADIRDDEDAVASEVHARLTGRAGARLLSGMIDTAKGKGAMATAEAVSVVDSLKRWLTEMLDALKATLGKWSKRNLDELTIEDFNNLTLRDIAEGVNPQEGELSDARFHAAMSRGREDFDAVRERAIAERGIVTPGLNRKEIRVVDVPRHDFTGTGKQALKAAEKWAKENITGNHTATDSRGDKFEYSISGDAVEKYVSRSATIKSGNIGAHLAALKKLPRIISESVEAEIHADYKKHNGQRSAKSEVNTESLVHRFYGAANINGVTYRVKTTIRQYRDMNRTPLAHSYEITQIELLEMPSDGVVNNSGELLTMISNSSISAANLLQGVEKSYDPGKKLLEESRLSDARFHAAMSRGREDFDAVRERAIAERGIVTPGLNRKEIRVVDVPRHDFTGTGKQAIEKARLWADSNLIGNHHYHSGQHDGFTYVIDKTTLEKYLSSSSTKGSDNLGVHLAALKMLPEIINENIEAEIHVDYVKGNGKRSASNGIGNPDILIHRMFGAITIDGALYRVKTTIKEDRNERVTPYNYQVTELELLISGSETSDALSNSNSISAANLLQGVEKSYDPGKKLLEESRLSDVSEAEDVRYRSAGKNNTEDVNHQFNLDLNRYKNHELASGFRFNLGKPSKELISAGFPDLPISMRASLLSRKSGMERHPFNAEKLRDLVKSIQRPIAIFHYTKSNIRNLIVDAEYEGKHFLMGITLNYNTDGLEINSVSGIFPKESHEWIKWIQDGKAIRIDEKEKVLSIIDSLRTNPAESERIGLNLDTVANIVKTFENPIAEDVRYRSADVANRIERLFDDAVAGNLKGKSIEIGRLTEEGKKYLEDLSGIEMKEIVSLVLNPSDLVHVYRNHFNGNEKDLGNNIPLLKEDIRAIANVLAKPERVLYGEEPDGLRRKMFYFLSSAPDLGAYNLLEIHGDRKGNLTAKTFYKTKKAVSQRVLSLMKSEHLTSVTDGASLSDANLPNFFELPTDDGYENLERSGDGSYSDAEVSMENDPWSKAWGETLRSKREQRAFAKRERERMRAKAVELSERLGVDIEIIEDNSSLEGKRGRSKGWYSVKDGRISVVIGNHVSVADIEKTVLHEAVAHHGLRELLGEHFDEFLDKVYDWADNSIKERIALLASRNGWNRRVATEEYLAGLAEDTDFENAKAYNGWWGKIRRLFLDMLSAVGFKRTGVELSDNELRYILWRSYKNMVEPGRFRAFEWEAEDVAMKYNLKAGEYAESSPVTEQRVAEAGELYELNDRFNNELNRQIAGDLPQGHVYDMGMPSEYLLSTGIARLPIRLSAKILNVKSNLERHAYNLETLRNLVYAIQKPWAIFSYGDRSKAQNMIIGIEDNGRQFLVGISINPTIKGRVLEINSIRNVFPKNNHEWVNWINEGKLLRVDGKKEIQDIIAKLRMNPVAFDYVDLDNAAKIVENFKNPTIREQNNNAGESSDDGVRYRMGDFTPRDRKIAADVYDKMVSSARFEFSEAMQDSMLGLKKLYEAIKGKKGFRIEEVEGYENAYTYENRMSSTNGNEQHLYFIRKMKPLLKAISDICGNSDSERRILTDYMIAKHGLERNVILAERDAREAASKGADYNDELAKCRQRDYSGLTALTGEKDLATAERVAQQMVDDYERDTDTTELWSRVKSATEATLEKMYTSGLMSEDRFNQVRGMFQHYIPLRGWDETTSNEVYTYLLQDDHATGTSLTKKAGGRSSKADDPIANIAAMADSAISQGNRNIMKQRFLNFVLNNPSDLVSHNELWLEHDAVNDEWRPVFAELDAADTPADVAKKIEAFEARMESLQAQHPDKYKRGSEAVNIPYKVVGNNLREHQVLVRRNGATTVLTINGNPRAAQALNGLTNPDVKAGSHYDEALSVVMYVNRQLSALYTTRNPDFVVSNFMRDMLYSNCMTWVKETPSYALRYHRNFGKFNPAVMAKLLNKYENGTLNSNDYIEHAFEQFMANGGETGFTNLKDIEGHKRAIAKELRRQGNVALRGWSALGMKLDLMNRSVENCARFAAYVTSREMGRSVDRSVYDAKEISVNFNKKGSGGTMAQKNRTLLGKIGAHTSGWGRLLYVFWNAGIQGMTNYGRAAKRNPAKATAAATALFSLGWVIPLLAQAGGGDDDDKNAYYNLPSYIRRSNICFRAGEQWVTIPLPIEYRAIYGLGELAYGAISGNERYSDDELCLEVMAQFSQLLPIDMLEGGGGLSPFIPSAAKPGVEAYMLNKSWTGLPIYKDTGYNKDDPEWTKAYKNADQHLVKASRWLNEVSGGDDFKKGSWWGDVNPAKLEYLLNGMFGGMVSFPSKVVKTVETIGGSREFEWRNIPLANRVIRSGDERTANRRLKSDYYKYKKEAMDAKRLARKYESRGQEGFMEYAEKADFLYNSPEYRRALVFTDYEPDIKALEQSIDDAGDPNVRKMLETDLYSTMREMVNELDGIAQE
ncbi:LPD38 domain-containing protein [uncultured Muribaculum sp.]|uniref:LPD38 domain-containing protein n=1 Tax=uncultured Muribaculum sp. TaxID=1918613 RepID=UPI0025B1BC44|nr:LPD38 domain-containing protein [uncultured Muribaculum sp.]